MITATSTLGRIRRWTFGIAIEETTVARRGFEVSAPLARERLEQVGRSFVTGYHAALEAGAPETLDGAFDDLPASYRGFAVEGSAMGLALLDLVTPWNRGRVDRLLRGWGDRHAYMIHIGVGWALARLHRSFDRALARMDPLLGWLAVDGYGFHEGYFDWRRSIVGRAVPKALSGYARRAFDQGLGRSLWFVRGTSPDAVAGTIATFPPERRPDLWSGVGLACAYAGGVPRDAVLAVRAAAGELAPHAAQGAAFAAKARLRAQNPAEHTDLACSVLCGMSAAAAAAVTDTALEGLAAEAGEPAYEVWRGRIRSALSSAPSFAPSFALSREGLVS